jgi:hypothetical protein
MIRCVASSAPGKPGKARPPLRLPCPSHLENPCARFRPTPRTAITPSNPASLGSKPTTNQPTGPPLAPGSYSSATAKLCKSTPHLTTPHHTTPHHTTPHHTPQLYLTGLAMRRIKKRGMCGGRVGPPPALWHFIPPAPAPGLSQPRFILIRNRKAGSTTLHQNFERCSFPNANPLRWGGRGGGWKGGGGGSSGGLPKDSGHAV